MAAYCGIGNLRHSPIEYHVNQLRSSGVVGAPFITNDLIITLMALCEILKIPCKRLEDANIITVLCSMKQYERDCFYAICRLAFVLIRNPLISDSELSNVLLHDGYGCLEDLNLFGLISIPSDYPLYAPCRLLFPDKDVQCFLAAIHLLTHSSSLMLSFIKRDVLVVDADPSSLLVLRYMFGLADTIPGICSSTVLLFTVRNDFYEEMTPVHPEMANGGGDDSSGVIDYDYLVPFHQTTDEDVQCDHTESLDIKNELVCGRELPLIPRGKLSIIRLCNESQPMPPPHRYIHQERYAPEFSTLVLPSSQGYDITQPPYEISLEEEEHEDITMDDSPISVVDQDEGIYYMYVYMAGDLSRKSPEPTDMRATLTTCCYDRVSSVPEPDWNILPGITPDSTMYPEDSQIQHHFQEIPVVEEPISQDGGPFPDKIKSTHQNVCEVVRSITKQLNPTNVLNNWNGNETPTLEVYHEGTFYAVRKATFNWRDVIAPKLTFMNIIQLVAMVMMGHPPLQQGHMMYHYYPGISYYHERCIIGSYFVPLRSRLYNLKCVAKEIFSVLTYFHIMPSPHMVPPPHVLVWTIDKYESQATISITADGLFAIIHTQAIC